MNKSKIEIVSILKYKPKTRPECLTVECSECVYHHTEEPCPDFSIVKGV